MAEKTPIDQGIIDRVVQGVKYVVTGNKPDSWFGADNPQEPHAQEQAAGRQVDYLTALNIAVQAREYDGTPIKDKFTQLRSLADGWDILRLVIETRKDQICALDWDIKYKDKEKKDDAKVETLKAFFSYPDKVNNHETWLRAILEDLFVIDAPCAYPRLTRGGQLYSLDLMDGSTIKKVIDDTGRIPLPPSPAYQQILKGLPAVDYNRDELIYLPRNVRTNKLYGYSPVEQIIVTINIALRRQLGQFQYYKEGNVPEALASVPESWSASQLKEFQQYWDAIIEGNMAQRRKLKFIPHGVSYIPTKEPVLKDDYDEWLARVVCFAFSISPQAFAKMMNRSTAETAQESAADEGLKPLMNWVEHFHNYIIQKYFGINDICFKWKSKKELDPKTQAEIDQIYVNSGIKTKNEVRGELGLEPLNEEELTLESVNSLENADNKEEMVGKKQAGLPILKNFSIKKAGRSKSDRVGEVEGAVTEKITDQFFKLSKTTSQKIGKAWGILNRWQKNDYDRVYISGTTEGKAYFEDVYGTLTLKSFAKEGGNAEILDEQIQKQLEKAFGDFWREVYYPQMETSSAITYADIVAKSKGVNDYINKIKDVKFDVIAKEISPDLVSAFKEGGAAGFEAISYKTSKDDYRIINDLAADWAKERGLELAKLDKTTKDFLRPTIESAISDGLTVDELKSSLQKSYAFSDYRASMIARTELAFADEQGNFAAWKQSGIVKFKRSLLGTNENHGEDDIANAAQGIIPIDKPFQNGDMMPPYHPNCFLAGTIVSAAGISKHYKRWFDGEIIIISVEGLEDTSVTPNHPILTQRGWVAAGQLQETDYLVKSLNDNIIVNILNPNNNQVQTAIEDIPSALQVAGHMLTMSVPLTAEDFHGDGIVDTEVDIIFANGLLPNNVESEILKSGIKRQFSGRHDGRIILDSDGSFAKGEIGMFHTSDGVVSSSSSSDLDGSIEARIFDKFSFGHIADKQIKPFKVIANDSAIDSDAPSNINTRLAGHIAFVPIKNLAIRIFAGHVYNLQTDDGYYIANNLIVHNCMCSLIPIIDDKEVD